MLTTLSWVPKGAMRTEPIYTADTVEQIREKLRRQHPEYDEGESDSSALRHRSGGRAKGASDAEVAAEVAARLPHHGVDADSDDDETATGGLMNRIAGGDGILEQVESDDDDEVEDTHFKETDLVLLTACADKEQPRLELYVYDEPEDKLFVHHDMSLSAYPLCSAWLSDGAMSMTAIGTMLPFIEVWALDVIDAVEPAFVLGGCARSEDNYRRKLKKSLLLPHSHTDAVLSVRWNTVAQHILASGSADASIKLWDLNQQTCVGTYTEPSKVQTLDWHRTEANLLLSGGFDGVAVLRDCRNPDQAALRIPTNDTIEHAEFLPAPTASSSAGVTLLTSTTSGTWSAFDARNAAAPLWTHVVHDGETTFSCSPHVMGLLATGGKDGKITLWDGRRAGVAPTPIVTRSYRTGSVFAIQFHPNSPHILGACGSRGEPLVYTITSDVADIFAH